MQRSKQELEAVEMSWIFYIRFILLSFPIAIIICSVFWIVITCSSIWLKAIGASILFFNILSIIFAIISIILILFCIIGIMPNNFFIPQAFFVSTVLCFVISFITLSLSTEQSSAKYYSDIVDYCKRNALTMTDLKSICFARNSDWEISRYVHKRTIEMYDIYVGILAPYVIIFVIFIILCTAVPSKKKRHAAQPLNNQLSASDDQGDYINIEDDQNTINNDDTENLLSNNHPQQTEPHDKEEKLNINTPEVEYEYITEEEEEQDDNVDASVNQQNRSRNSHEFIKPSDSA